MDRHERNRVVIPTRSKYRQPGARSSGGRANGKPREGLLAISVIAAATLATFGALFLTSRPYDPMNSTFEAQQAVPQAPLGMQSPKTSPTPTPSPSQNVATPATPEPTPEVVVPDDTTIQADIEKTLRSNPALADLDVSTIVERGRVTIVGSVRSVELKQRVQRAISSVKGVQSVDNQLVVIEGSPQ